MRKMQVDALVKNRLVGAMAVRASVEYDYRLGRYDRTR